MFSEEQITGVKAQLGSNDSETQPHIHLDGYSPDQIACDREESDIDIFKVVFSGFAAQLYRRFVGQRNQE